MNLDHNIPLRNHTLKAKWEASDVDADHLFFLTLTLPPSAYRCGLRAQRVRMQALIRSTLFFIFALSAYGVFEVTSKGNIHAHMIVKLAPERGYVDHTEILTPYAMLKLTQVKLKSLRLPMYDFQMVKDRTKVINYLLKDVKETAHLFAISSNTDKVPSPYFKWISRDESPGVNETSELRVIPQDMLDMLDNVSEDIRYISYMNMTKILVEEKNI